MIIDLYTADHKLVKKGLKIPPFKDWPDVIIWGQRIFQYYSEYMINPDNPEMIAEYRECFCWIINES